MNIKTLLPDLKHLVTELDEDLLARAQQDDKIDAGLRLAFQQVEKGGRTAQAFEVWREDYLDQVAVAWVLACVFVRFMEDNHLIDECWLAGTQERRKLAEDTHELFFRKHPHDTDREYFHHVFHEVGKIPAAKELFAEGKTPLWAVAPSGDAAMKLLAFWREIDPETGQLTRRFNHETHEIHEKEAEKKASSKESAERKYDSSSFSCGSCVSWFDPTRFLGDLYQELSEKAKKKYALLQTPVFVEEFILDRTLNPAIDEFGLEKVRLIDPTCGSGHFLLGAFARLFRLWMKRENNEIVAAQKALDGVWGVDINPFAVAIARFRLIVAALQVCGIKSLKRGHAPGWKIHLAAGDSLLFGSKPGYGGERERLHRQGDLFEVPAIYAVEEAEAVDEILGQAFQVVVGNPPYITVKDKAQNEEYRRLYSTCHRQYSLGVPFTQRFWELAIQLGEANGGCGHVGMITANSFMKREFGKKLIEEFFPKIDLSHVIDTSGAYIPGHGTPTVILFGRNRKPIGETVRAVLGIKGEPATPDDPTKGLVWQSIVTQIDRAGAQDEYTSAVDVFRTTFANHPWSIGGGGASELKQRIDEYCRRSLAQLATSIGFYQDTHADEVFVQPLDFVKRHELENCFRLHIRGDDVRDWRASASEMILFPYDENLDQWPQFNLSSKWSWLYCQRTALWNRRTFDGSTYRTAGRSWYDFHQFPKDRARIPFSITFACVTTDNHFVFDRNGRVFNRHAPLIKLKNAHTEDDFLSLLGLLNSSIASFWMKQVMSCKGLGGQGGGIKPELWFRAYEYAGTQLELFPIPEKKPLALARQLDVLARQYGELLPEAIVAAATPTAERLSEARTQAEAIRAQMIALQEELDWQCYALYGLEPRNTRSTRKKDQEEDELFFISDFRVFRVFRGLSLGERAFEIVMARQMANGELQTTWFARHGSTPITELPKHWPAEYRKLVERRIKLIETNKEIGLIERPEYKRRWNAEPWEQQEQRALKNWLLDRLEDKRYWPRIELQSTAQLADRASADAEFMQVAALYRGRPDFDLAALVAELVEGESVPFLPVLRYKASGLRKREVWERTWELQREEDRTTKHTNHTKKDREEDAETETDSDPDSSFRVVRVFRGSIPIPPKYTSADFQKTAYWRLRGKLDVPKERWISYPHCQSVSDPTLVVGWAGWNHLEQAAALVTYYDGRKREGWDAKRLTPLLAGLVQLLPWIHQWHPEIDKEFGETAGKSYQSMLEQDAHELGLTLEDIRTWQPPEKQRKTRTTRKQKEENDD